MPQPSPRIAIAAALLSGFLGALPASSAGPKSAGIYTVTDDLPTGSAGSVGLSGGGFTVSGSLGQLNQTTATGSGTVEGGYFSKMVSSPTSPSSGGVFPSSFSYVFGDPGNPTATDYRIFVSTDNFGTLSVVFSTSISPAFILGSGQNYAVRSAAQYMQGDQSAFSSAVDYSPPPPPGLPGTPVGAALGVSSMTWTWTAATNAANYAVYQTTSPSSAVGSTPGLSLAQTGLAPNTTSSVFVQASNASGTGPASSTATAVYTLAAPPTGLASSAVEATSGALSWSLNGNPSGTIAQVERSTDNIVFGNVFTGGATTMTDSSLIGCTQYYYRARNRNGNSIATGYSGTASFTTKASTPSAPSSLTAEPMTGNRIALSWVPSPTEGVTQYKLYEVGSGTGSYGSSIAVFTSTETSYATGVLSAGTHGFALRAVHRCGVEESSGTYASANSIAAVSSVRTAIKSPNTGKRIRGNSVTIIAELTGGNPIDVNFATFQIKLASATSWTNIAAANANHPNPDLDSPYFIQWDADAYGAANGYGPHDIRAVAMNVADSSDTAPSSIRIDLVNKNSALIAGDDYDIKEDGGSKEQVVNNAVANTISAAGSGAEAPSIKILVPAGALNGSTVTATVIANPVITTAAPRGFSLVGSALQIDLSNGQSTLNVPATVTLSYPESADGHADMQIQSLDPLTGAWSAIGASTRDRTLRTLTAATPHFSVFAIIAGAGVQPDLSRVRAYPVPFKPNGNDPNEGKPYSVGDATSGIIFDQLPVAVKINIFTLSGRLVAQFDTSAGTGTIQWDAKNADGRDAASGGYFAVISSPGSKNTVKRLLIIR